MFTWLQSPGFLSSVALACCSIRYIWLVCRIWGVSEGGEMGVRQESMQSSFRLGSPGCAAASNYLRGKRRDWSNPALKASPRLAPPGSLITPPKAWISVRTNQRASWGNRNAARHSFVCEANTRQVLSTESMFDLLMRVRRSERHALLWQFSCLEQMCGKNNY